jgi:hypothetical protein
MSADEAPVAALELEGRPIRSIRVEPHNIFDPPPPGRLGWVYRTANALHVRTRATTVVRQLPFEAGDIWTTERGREALRTLRNLDILVPTRLEAAAAGDSVDVTVVTRDAWTTALEFAAAGGDGRFLGSVSLVERNLLGLGKLIAFSYRDDQVSFSRGAAYEDRALFGSRVDLSASAANGSDGASQSVSVGLPFYALDSRASYGAEWFRTTSVARLFLSDSEAATFDRRHEALRLWAGRGVQTADQVLRAQATLLVDDRRYGPSRLVPGAPADFAGDEENRRIRQLEIEGRLWRPRFVEKRMIDQMGGIEDFDVGTSIRVSSGYSPRFLGASADEGVIGGGLDAGFDHRRGLGLVRSEFRTRLRHGAREGRGSVVARWASSLGDGHTLVLGADGTALIHPARDAQLIFGSLNGLRAFGIHEAAGERGWRFNAEERWTIGRDLLDVFAVGLAAFYDAARVWGPGAEGVGWRQDLGGGLRVSLPRAAFHRVARLDIAWPVGGDHRPGGPVISFGSSQAF